MSVITAPGAYPDIPAETYHGPEICPSPSIGSSGLKLLLNHSPRHYWWQSPLNPDRPVREEKTHFAVGKAAHDMVLLPARWPEMYHVTPEGFSRSKTKAMAVEIAEADAAVDAGLTILSHEDAIMCRAMADAISANPIALSLLSAGQPEVTLAWQDRDTGVWLRARPDFLPDAVRDRGRDVRVVPDLKFMADGCPRAFSRSIADKGYAMAAALYADGIKAVFGAAPTHWAHVVVEKAEPYVVSLYELPPADIERGRFLNKRAIRLFADCLSSGRWPGYADDPIQVGLPQWERKTIDEGNADEVAAMANGMAFAA